MVTDINTQRTKPEPQSIRDCAALRENCQKDIFNKIDNQRITLEKKIDDQREKLENKMDGHHKIILEAITKKQKEWWQIMIDILIEWAPGIGLIFILGLYTLLKSKNLI